MELGEIIKALSEHDAKTVADALHAGAAQHYNTIFSRGFGTAKGEFQGAAEQAAEEARELQAKLKETQALADAQGKPNEKYEALLEQKERERMAAVAAAEKAEEQYAQRMAALHTERILAEAQAALTAAHVDADYARIRLADPALRERLRVTADGTAKFYQEDGSTPHPLAPGQTPAAVLAETIRSATPEKFIENRKAQSTGFNGQSGAASTKVMSRSQFEALPAHEQMKFMKGGGGVE